MVSDAQVRLVRWKGMEEKTQEAAAAAAGEQPAVRPQRQTLGDA